MPQKKNPDPLELVRGKTGRAIGHLIGAADDDEGAAERLQQGSAGGQGGGVRRRGHAGRLPGASCESVVDGLTLNRERAARGGVGPAAGDRRRRLLVGRGVPFRRAHEVVGALVRKLVAEGRDFESLSLEEWRARQRAVRRRRRRPRHAARPRWRPSGRRSPRRRRRSSARWRRSRRGWTARRGSGLASGNELC